MCLESSVDGRAKQKDLVTQLWSPKLNSDARFLLSVASGSQRMGDAEIFTLQNVLTYLWTPSPLNSPPCNPSILLGHLSVSWSATSP